MSSQQQKVNKKKSDLTRMAVTLCHSHYVKTLRKKIVKLVGNLDHYEPKVKDLFELSVCCEKDMANETQSQCTCENAGRKGLRLFTPTCRPPVPRVGRQTYRMWKAMVQLGSSPFAKSRLNENPKTLHFLPLEKYICSVVHICLSQNKTEKDGACLNLGQIAQDSISVTEFLVLFLQAFFPGLNVILDECYDISEMEPAPVSRLHKLTNKRQFLVTDIYKRLHSTTGINKKDYILGLMWTDLYPSEPLNFALGEALFSHRCAVFSFGRYEPLSFSQKQEDLPESQFKDKRGNGDVRPSPHNEIKENVTPSMCSNHTNAFSHETEEEDIQKREMDQEEKDIVQEMKDHNSTLPRDKNSPKGGDEDILKIDGELLWKMMRVSSHEVCHLFGLSHCVFFHCAMNESKSVAQALNQPLHLCPVCLRKLQKFFNFDVTHRYMELLDICVRAQGSYPCEKLKETVEWYSHVVNFLSEDGNKS